MRTSVAAIVVLCAVRASADVTVSVDAGAGQHPISPLIYGMNFPDSGQLAAKVPIARWGGNATSRYNYQIDVHNTGNDYYFENLPACWTAAANNCNPVPTDPMEHSDANAFLSSAQTAGAIQLFTLPTLGYVAKPPAQYSHPFTCGCPRTFAGNQDDYDAFDTNCGNCKVGGAYITPPATPTTSMAITPTWDADWVTYLTTKFGPSNGKRIYALDNEPALWSSTQHDVHPTKLTYDELWQRMRDHAVAILGVDATAQISGPAEWGWPNYLCSDADNIQNGCSAASPDRAAHGGEELVAWLLDQANAYEQQHGTRILHYFDLHYYPQGGNPPENLRSLWDPTYVDPSFINDTIRLIPRMHDWVNQHYPGTKLLLSEYDFYHHDEALGAVTYAEALGIFGREGLDAATAWSPPATTDAAFGAFLLYLNYDGAGGHFETTSVQTMVMGTGVAAFAATGGTQMTLVLVNETATAAPVTVQLQNFGTGTTASYFTGAGPTIAKQPDVAVAAGQLAVTVPAMSFALLAIPRDVPLGDDSATSGDGAGSTGKTGGCGCRTSDPGGALALVLVGFAVLRRRRGSLPQGTC
jgi:MYXO-CTERM domain-containing protein